MPAPVELRENVMLADRLGLRRNRHIEPRPTEHEPLRHRDRVDDRPVAVGSDAAVDEPRHRRAGVVERLILAVRVMTVDVERVNRLSEVAGGRLVRRIRDVVTGDDPGLDRGIRDRARRSGDDARDARRRREQRPVTGVRVGIERGCRRLDRRRRPVGA